MRIVSWNVAGRRARLPEQAAAVAAASPDVVALQEVTAGSLPLWREALAEAGLEHTLTPLDDALPPKPRRLGTLLAAREPLERVGLDGLPWPERAVAAGRGDLTILNVHSPISPSPGLAKVLTHEALYDWAAPRERTVIVGDLNTPRRDLPDGTVLTFAHDSKGRLREERGERWAAAERALVHTLRDRHGWQDAFGGTPERTWTSPRGRGGYRLDHALATPDVELGARAYAHEWRTGGLSDHSGVVVDVA